MTARHVSPLKTVSSILFIVLALALGLLLASTPALAEAPANDDFDTPALVTSLPYTDTLDTSEATADPDDPDCSWPYASVWYAFTPVTDLRIEADTVNSAYDTALSVYTGTRTDLTQLACNDNWNSAQSFVTLEVEAGVTYYFMITGHSWWEPGGDLVLTIQESVPPANDDFDNAEEITILPFEAPSVNVIAATVAADDPVCSDQPANIWYKYTPTDTGWLETDPLGNYYTTIGVYTGIRGDLTEIACKASWTYPESIRFEAQVGATYYFMVGPPSFGGYFVAFNLRESVPPPSNDDFAGAEVITTLPYTHTADTTTATTTTEDPDCYDANATVWYSYTPPAGMRVEVSASLSASAASISIYTADQGVLTQLICQYQSSGESFLIDLPAGETYYFMVGSPSPSTGSTLTFSLDGEELPPVAPNDDFDDAKLISTLPFTDTVYTDLATREPDDPNCAGVGSTIWYAFAPTSFLQLEAVTISMYAEVTIGVYTGEHAELEQLACQSAYPGAPLLIDVAPGQTYYFMVSNVAGDVTFSLDGEATETPPNDDFDNATVIGALPFSATVDVSEATSAVDDPSPSCGGGSRTIWYAYTPAETVWLETDPFDGYASAIAVFTGTRGNLTEIACDFDFYGGSLRFLAQAGTAYYFMVSDPFFWVDWVTMNLRQLGSPPPNDNFDTPTIVGTLPYLDMLDTVYAGPADDDPDSACFSYDNTVWYAFTPTHNMQVTADVHPTLGLNAYGAALAVYTGERGSLTELACADVYSAPLLLDLTAGTTYYFMVSTAAWYETGDLAFILEQDEFFLFLPAILKP